MPPVALGGAPRQRLGPGERPRLTPELPHAQPAPAHARRRIVELERQHPWLRIRGAIVTRRHAVDERADQRPSALDAVVVPLTRTEGRARLGIVLERLQPGAALLVQTARPGARRGIDLDLVAEDEAALEAAAHLDAGVGGRVVAELELEHEVAERPLVDQESLALAA